MQIEGKNYSITGTRIPKSVRDFPFAKGVEEILGKKKFVSIALVNEKEIRKWNKAYRGKDKSTDILSFPSKEGGEILIFMRDVTKKSVGFHLSASDYLNYLFIHGMLHLKGLDHGSKMDIQEKKFCNFFKLKHPLKNERDQDNSRNRHRNVRGPSGRKSAGKR